MILFCNDIVERIFIKMSKKSKKNEKNYLDFIPVKNPDIEYETDGKASITKLPRKYSAARESAILKWISTEVSYGMR